MQLAPYIALMRLDKPVGIWLVFYPAAWAVAIASPYAPFPNLLLLLLLGAVLTRSAGCVVNDMMDRKLDAQVARTKSRPLAAGVLQIRQALMVLLALLSGAFALLFFLPHNPIILAVMVLPLIIAYPLMKRLTFWPQAFLGITFNTSALFGWFEATGSLPLEAFILYASCCFWTLGYDTIYALQDKEDDEKIGIKSTARAMGRQVHWLVAGSYTCCFAGFLWLGMTLAVGTAYFLALLIMAAHFTFQFRMVWLHGSTYATRLFLSNGTLGLLLFMGFMLDRYRFSGLW